MQLNPCSPLCYAMDAHYKVKHKSTMLNVSMGHTQRNKQKANLWRLVLLRNLESMSFIIASLHLLEVCENQLRETWIISIPWQIFGYQTFPNYEEFIRSCISIWGWPPLSLGTEAEPGGTTALRTGMEVRMDTVKHIAINIVFAEGISLVFPAKLPASLAQDGCSLRYSVQRYRTVVANNVALR